MISASAEITDAGVELDKPVIFLADVHCDGRLEAGPWLERGGGRGPGGRTSACSIHFQPIPAKFVGAAGHTADYIV